MDNMITSICTVRDGFVFINWNDNRERNVLVIRDPQDAKGATYTGLPLSRRSLQEHIDLINKEGIERVHITAEDLSFINKCPSLNQFSIVPPNSVKDHYDYSPLYQREWIKMLNCQTVYGDKWQFSTTIDYSKIQRIEDLGVYGKGHENYQQLDSLQKLFVSKCKNVRSVADITACRQLKDLSIWLSGIRSLDGIEKLPQLQDLYLYSDRSLADISKLSDIAASLQSLTIESCAKITDFSCLSELENLESLELYGSNKLPNLAFLSKLKKLKHFNFSVEVEDGDLTPCLDIPYVWCAKNRKHYNLKDKDLPKN